jgi:hypothetical protein
MGRKPYDVPEEALEKYEEFHRHKPEKVGSFASSFRIPTRIVYGGKSKWVTYRSRKIDPETMRRPKRPVDYIHEHDAGVVTYLVPERGSSETLVPVPERIRNADVLVNLGVCLGFCFESGTGGKQEVEATAPMPDLYCTADGKCLLVIQSKRKVLAMMWGGALGVFARGIDG